MKQTHFGLFGALSVALAPSLAFAQPAPGAQPAPPPVPGAPIAAPAAPTAAPAAPMAAAPGAPAAAPAVPAVAAPSPPIPALSDERGKQEERAKESADAYLVPDAPAFTILGITPATIDRPATITKLGSAIANIVTDKGTVRSGVALEVSLRGLGLLDRRRYHDYATQFATRFLARTALSIASVSDSATAMTPAQTRLALGLRLVIFDESDPLLAASYVAEVNQAIKDCAPLKENPGEQAKCEVKKYNEMETKGAVIRWNYGGLAIGAAQSTAFQEARIKDGEADQFGAWLTGAFGVSTWLQQSLGAKYVRGFAADTHVATFAERTRVGTEHFRGSLEVSYAINSPKDSDVPKGQVSLGTELKISDAVWLVANVGGAINDASDVASLFAISNLKWNLESKPSWTLK
jgi:hypothetical protein